MRRPDDLRDGVRARLLLALLSALLGTPATAAAAPVAISRTPLAAASIAPPVEARLAPLAAASIAPPAEVPLTQLPAASLATPAEATLAPPAAASLVPLAADSPFGSNDDAKDDAGGDGAGERPADGRLGRTASALRRSPLSVDPEMDWMFDARTRRSLLRTIEGARIKIFVAALPVIDEDESGGDFERIIRALQQGVGQDGLYVVVDQDGRMDLASVGVPLDLGISFSLLYPDRDERPYDEQARDPAPPPWTSVPDRLREIVATVEKAGPGEPNDVEEARGELRPLYVDYRGERLREDAIFGLVAGGLLGLTAAGSLLGILHLVRRSRGGGGGGRPPRPGPRPSARQGRASRRRRRSRRA